MIKIEVDKLSNEKLNELCAKSQGWIDEPNFYDVDDGAWINPEIDEGNPDRVIAKDFYTPTDDAEQAMELLESFDVSLLCDSEFCGMRYQAWVTTDYDVGPDMWGETALIAICKAVVGNYLELNEVENENC